MVSFELSTGQSWLAPHIARGKGVNDQNPVLEVQSAGISGADNTPWPCYGHGPVYAVPTKTAEIFRINGTLTPSRRVPVVAVSLLVPFS